MRRLLAGSAVLVLPGCEGIQSALAPKGADASLIAQVSWVVFIGAGLIFALVLGLTLYALLAPQARSSWTASHGFIIGGGIVFPVVTLTALLVYGLSLTGSVGRSTEVPAVRIEVTGEQFWWRVRYQEHGGKAAVDAANELHIPVGQPVELTLRSADVIHSFWVPNLAGKLDMIPGQQNVLSIKASAPGTYRGQCAEYCGIQHAQMAFYVVAHPPEAFERWLAERREPAAEPLADLVKRGRDLFVAVGCGACHTVRGIDASGKIGPDLTHVGSRRSIGAGMWPNNAGTLAAWIASSQHLKPGNKMPSFNVLSGTELRAVATYLESLK
ncbi:MAG: cytochrome c oxidase subunit II [Hyphomicrobiaceae bacterium]|nr:cytochrome c oxidase subunit II [Hyphomicrobiaceae bacterium]